MSAGVSSTRIIGGVISGPTTIMTTEDKKVAVIVVPTVEERWSLSFAPKYWEVITVAPMEIPIKSTSSRFRIGVLAPIAARAPSPT